ncbi:FAD-binding protein [Quillaja saponaria]|nr:FAD-binding protein [Quillaja saponaria]
MRVKSYFEAGCINTHDAVQNLSKLNSCKHGLMDHLSKAKVIVTELDGLLEDMTNAIQTTFGNLPPIWDMSFGDELNEQSSTENKEEMALSHFQSPHVTHFATLMAIIYSMVKQDYVMQEKIISALNMKSSSGELESYCLMWSLRPYINEEVMHQAWKHIP